MGSRIGTRGSAPEGAYKKEASMPMQVSFRVKNLKGGEASGEIQRKYKERIRHDAEKMAE